MGRMIHSSLGCLRDKTERINEVNCKIRNTKKKHKNIETKQKKHSQTTYPRRKRKKMKGGKDKCCAHDDI